MTIPPMSLRHPLKKPRKTARLKRQQRLMVGRMVMKTQRLSASDAWQLPNETCLPRVTVTFLTLMLVRRRSSRLLELIRQTPTRFTLCTLSTANSFKPWGVCTGLLPWPTRQRMGQSPRPPARLHMTRCVARAFFFLHGTRDVTARTVTSWRFTTPIRVGPLAVWMAPLTRPSMTPSRQKVTWMALPTRLAATLTRPPHPPHDSNGRGRGSFGRGRGSFGRGRGFTRGSFGRGRGFSRNSFRGPRGNPEAPRPMIMQAPSSTTPTTPMGKMPDPTVMPTPYMASYMGYPYDPSYAMPPLLEAIQWWVKVTFTGIPAWPRQWPRQWPHPRVTL